jgi:putative transposase
VSFHLSDLFIMRGVPAFIRSDNGPEFVAQAVWDWIAAVGAQTAYIEPGSSWENGYCESFNARFRDELLNGEVFYSLREANILIERWRKHYNTIRPHSALGYRPPAPENHRPDGPKAAHALTIKLDHSSGADQLGLLVLEVSAK